jgi:hypothetical protein
VDIRMTNDELKISVVECSGTSLLMAAIAIKGTHKKKDERGKHKT